MKSRMGYGVGLDMYQVREVVAVFAGVTWWYSGLISGVTVGVGGFLIVRHRGGGYGVSLGGGHKKEVVHFGDVMLGNNGGICLVGNLVSTR